MCHLFKNIISHGLEDHNYIKKCEGQCSSTIMVGSLNKNIWKCNVFLGVCWLVGSCFLFPSQAIIFQMVRVLLYYHWGDMSSSIFIFSCGMMRMVYIKGLALCFRDWGPTKLVRYMQEHVTVIFHFLCYWVVQYAFIQDFQHGMHNHIGDLRYISPM